MFSMFSDLSNELCWRYQAEWQNYNDISCSELELSFFQDELSSHLVQVVQAKPGYRLWNFSSSCSSSADLSLHVCKDVKGKCGQSWLASTRHCWLCPSVQQECKAGPGRTHLGVGRLKNSQVYVLCSVVVSLHQWLILLIVPYIDEQYSYFLLPICDLLVKWLRLVPWQNQFIMCIQINDVLK